jgi:hypothetical protein
MHSVVQDGLRFGFDVNTGCPPCCGGVTLTWGLDSGLLLAGQGEVSCSDLDEAEGGITVERARAAGLLFAFMSAILRDHPQGVIASGRPRRCSKPHHADVHLGG